MQTNLIQKQVTTHTYTLQQLIDFINTADTMVAKEAFNKALSGDSQKLAKLKNDTKKLLARNQFDIPTFTQNSLKILLLVGVLLSISFAPYMDTYIPTFLLAMASIYLLSKVTSQPNQVAFVTAMEALDRTAKIDVPIEHLYNDNQLTEQAKKLLFPLVEKTYNCSQISGIQELMTLLPKNMKFNPQFLTRLLASRSELISSQNIWQTNIFQSLIKEIVPQLRQKIVTLVKTAIGVYIHKSLSDNNNQKSEVVNLNSFSSDVAMYGTGGLLWLLNYDFSAYTTLVIPIAMRHLIPPASNLLYRGGLHIASTRTFSILTRITARALSLLDSGKSFIALKLSRNPTYSLQPQTKLAATNLQPSREEKLTTEAIKTLQSELVELKKQHTKLVTTSQRLLQNYVPTSGADLQTRRTFAELSDQETNVRAQIEKIKTTLMLNHVDPEVSSSSGSSYSSDIEQKQSYHVATKSVANSSNERNNSNINTNPSLSLISSSSCLAIASSALTEEKASKQTEKNEVPVQIKNEKKQGKADIPTYPGIKMGFFGPSKPSAQATSASFSSNSSYSTGAKTASKTLGNGVMKLHFGNSGIF